MPPASTPLATARAGVRRARWPALLAGAGGAATVGLLGAAGFAPLLAGMGAGALATSPVVEWLTSMGMNALAGWVGNLATDGMQAALAEDAPDLAWLTALAQRLDAAAASDQSLAAELATFLKELDAVPLALAAIAEEQGAQRDLLLAQHDLLQRLSADMERLKLAGGALGPVVAAEAERIITTITARADTRFDQILAAITALRDAQRQALINFAGAQMGDVTFQGDVAGGDIHKPTLGAGGIYAPAGLHIGTMQVIEVKDNGSVGSIVNSQVSYGGPSAHASGKANAIANQHQFLDAHRATLAHYLHQLAISGTAHARPEVTHGIREARAGIARAKAALTALGVSVEDQPEDRP